MPPLPRVAVCRLRGLVSYDHGQRLQRALLDQLRAGVDGEDTLLLLEHEPVFTLGRLQESASNLSASTDQISAAGASVVQSDRGGNVTFHGPGQLVAYPLLDLRNHQQSVHWYVSALEDAMIGAAARVGVGSRRGGEGHTGVWVDDRKLGALGVRVTRWMSSHGVALNADVDLDFFSMMVPCGLHDAPQVTSHTRELGRACGVDEAAPAFCDAFGESLGVELYESDRAETLLREVRAAAAAEDRGTAD
jgi:lipoate-protein ligase B